MGKPVQRLSVVIAHLQALQAEYGDIPVLLEDPDTGWPMVPDIAYSRGDPDSDYPGCEWIAIGPCVTISGDYTERYTPVLPAQKD